MNLLIAVPTFENIEPDVFKSIYQLRIPSPFSNCDFESVRGYDCARARNVIAQKAIEGNYHYILMIDSDVVVPKDTLERFCEVKPPEVLLGVYPRKGSVKKSEVFSFNADNYSAANQYGFDELWQMRDIHGAHRIVVKGGGMGCALIKTSIFENLDYPWFAYSQYPNRGILSEDLYFCENVRKHGGRIMVDTRVFCGHIKKTTLYE